MVVKKNILSLIFVGITIIITFYICNINLGEQFLGSSKSTTPFGAITSTNSVVQEIDIIEDARLETLTLRMATYARTNNNTNFFALYVNDKLSYTHEFKSNGLKDNLDYSIRNINLDLKSGDVLRFEITSSDTSKNNAVTIWIDENNKVGKLYRKNTETGEINQIEGMVNFALYEHKTVFEDLFDKYRIYPCFAVTLIISIFIVCFACLKIIYITIKETIYCFKNNDLGNEV